MLRYRDMRRRINGCPHKRSRSEGQPLLSQKEFLEWCAGSYDYITLHAAWVDSGFDPKLSPSIHRVDESKGYVLGNMMWVTRAEHERMTAAERKK